MKKYTFLVIPVLLFCFAARAQKENEPSPKAKPDSICCCKDVDPCFKNDPFYKVLPPDNTKDILLDFKAKALGIPAKLKIRKGDFIRIKVTNYNPFLYRVSVENRDSSVTQPIDAGFLGMFLSPDKFTSAVAGLVSTVGTAPPSVSPAKKDAKELSKSDKLTYINKWYGVSPKPPMSLKDKSVDSVFNVIASNENTVETQLEAYVKYADSIKREIIALRKKIEGKSYAISSEFANLQKLYPGCDSLSESAIQRKVNLYADSLKNYSTEAKSLSLDLYTQSKDFKFKLAPYKTMIDSTASFKIRYNFVDTFFKIASAEVTGLDTSVGSKKISDMYAAFIKLTQNSICYTSLPIYIGNDVKVLSISLKPVDGNSNLPSYQTSFSIPDYQPRVWGVSGGIYICGLKNETYTNKRISDTSFNLITEKQNKIQIGVNALAYMGWQITPTRPNYLGISFGAGMSLESKPKPRILLGGSFITGEKNRINLSAGLVAGYVTQLSGGFSTTELYTKPAENYQRDYLKTSVFFSINYSFVSK